MGDKTKIDWCDASWNPVTGCLHGCEYCYARKIAERFGGYDGYGSQINYDNCKNKEDGLFVLQTPCRIYRSYILPFVKAPYPFKFAPTFYRYRLDIPFRWTRPRTIFVCSMADLFGEWVPDEWIKQVLDACEAAPQHRYLFLTKNPKRYESFFGDRYIPQNMWFGWSQTGPLGKGPVFASTHSMNTFVSIEPLLAPFHITHIRGIGWAIVGAETGNRKDKVVPKREWVEEIAEACAKANVPLFMKESLRDLMGDDFVQRYPWDNDVNRSKHTEGVE